jgi:5-methylcytosine-specific restriction endonuclease McrA
MSTYDAPGFVAGQPAARVDASLRQALFACDRAHECAVLWFAEVQRRHLYRQFGHASLQLYATQALGFSDNRYWNFKRLADDLDRLPVLREAVETGEVGWTKAQQVARVATAETQEAWVAKAATCGRRELAAAVTAARKKPAVAKAGQLVMNASVAALVPAPPVADAPVTIALRADGVRLARFEALVEKARKLKLVPDGADRMDLVLAGLEALVEAQARRSHAGGPAAQIVVQQCPDCAAAAAVTSRGERRLAPAQVEALACDARVRRPGKPNRATIAPAVRAAVLARDRHRCATTGCGSTSFLEVHHVLPRSRGGSNKAENLVTLCSRCHAFVHEGGGGILCVSEPGCDREIAPAQVAGVGPGE